MNDKLKHLIIGIIGAFAFNPFTGFLAAAIAGFVKEVLDVQFSGTADGFDFLVTALGGVIAAGVMMAL